MSQLSTPIEKLSAEINVQIKSEDGKETHSDFRCWFDSKYPKPAGCKCPENLKICRCVNPHCKNKFRPQCRGQIFCCFACFLSSDHDRISRLIRHYDGDMKKVKIALSRQRYRNSPKGKAARKREYKKRKRNGTTTSSKGKRSPPILGGTKNRCKRVGCGKHYEDSSDPRAGEKCYCCEDCRKFMNDFRKRTEENTCPIAAYILAIIELLYGK